MLLGRLSRSCRPPPFILASLTIDLDHHLRRIKVDKLVTPLTPRTLADLVDVAGFTVPPRASILVDTNVYMGSPSFSRGWPLGPRVVRQQSGEHLQPVLLDNGEQL